MSVMIFLDECGYTGQDLLNEQQPFFSITTLKCEEEECKQIKKSFFSQVKSNELKHLNLSRRPNQQDMIVDMLNFFSDKPQYLKNYIVNKKYALLCKLIDCIIEEMAYEIGYDLYDKGQNIALANMLYICIPAFGGNEYFDTLLDKFQNLIRHKSEKEFEDFFNFVSQDTQNQHLEELLDFIRPAKFILGYDILSPHHSLDISFTCALALMGMWRLDIEENIILVHDASTNMAKQKNIWDAIVDVKVPEAFVGYDRRKYKFPIRVEKTLFESSKDWAGIQLSDIISGSINYYAKWVSTGRSKDDIYGVKLNNVIGNLNVIPMLPSSNITPEELDTVGDNNGNILKFTSELVYQSRKL